MTLEVQKFLRSEGLAALEEKYKILARRHGKYNNLVSFKYHMIDSPMAERICQECRGLILDEDNSWAVVAHPFDKFFNYGEGHAAEIDWSTASVQEKLDGSLMILYHYDGAWHIASSGLPDASGAIDGSVLEWREGNKVYDLPKTFAEYFWRIANRTLSPSEFSTATTWQQDLKQVYPHFCFMFEMVGPLNRIVVRHPTSKVVLIGARNLISGKEISAEAGAKHLPGKVEVVKSFDLSSMEEIAATFDHMDPINQEGYVVVDGNFNRIKVKCPAYVALHHAKGNEVTHKDLLKIAVAGETDEWVSYFEEYQDDLLRLRLKLERFIVEVCEDYLRISREVGPEGTRKDFAILATKTKCPGALFSYYSGKCDSIRSYIRQIHIDKLLQLLGVK